MNDKPSDFGGLCFSRIVVVGANGAGKTWLADRIARAAAMPVVGKDGLALLTGWQQRSRTEVRAAIRDVITADRWVLEGGPSILQPEVLARADCVIWLDLPAGLRFRRIIWRSLRYLGRTRPEHPAGNRDWPGCRQWQFAWGAIKNDHAARESIGTALTDAAIHVVRLRTRAEVHRLLTQQGGSAAYP